MSSFGINVEIEYLRQCARSLRERVISLDSTIPGGTDGISALVLRQAATFILNAASLAEEYEANRMIKEEKSNVEA